MSRTALSARRLAPLLVALSLAAVARAQSPDLDGWIRRKMAEAKAPGVAACIVKHGGVAWAQGYGLRNVEKGLPVTPDTPFMLASISKTVTGTALMQLAEQGLYLLDDDVDPYLPFDVDPPNWPSDPITFRQLLSHVAGIRDNWGVMIPLYSRGDSPIPLGVFLDDYLVPGGLWYDPVKNYAPWAPGTSFEYSNIGFALNGFLVESISATPFDDYCDQAIFQPLGMQRTSWRIAGLVPDEVAMPYGWNGSTQSWVPYGYYGYPDYPNGCLRSSANDLARFLLAHMNGGTHQGATILQPGTVAQMQTVQYPALEPTQGLAFYHWSFAGMHLIGHAGGDLGVYTEMWWRPDQDTGVILFANGDAKIPVMFQVLRRLFREAEAL